MKIQREKGQGDIISFYFRIVNISKEIKDSLIPELSTFKIEMGRNRKNTKTFILTIDLNESFDLQLIKKILAKYQIYSDTYGLWVSIRSEYDHGGFTLPVDVANLYHELKGTFEVSYTII